MGSLPVLTEDQECFLLGDYLRLMTRTGKVLLFNHNPQETFTKNWGTKMKNKKMGVTKGFPDYCVVTRDAILFIEMKRTKGGTVGPEQKTWVDTFNNYVGVKARICYGFNDARKFIEEWM